MKQSTAHLIQISRQSRPPASLKLPAGPKMRIADAPAGVRIGRSEPAPNGVARVIGPRACIEPDTRGMVGTSDGDVPAYLRCIALVSPLCPHYVPDLTDEK